MKPLSMLNGHPDRTKVPGVEANTGPLGHGLEEGSAKHRGEDQGHEHGKKHGGDDGDGELPVDDAGGAGEEDHVCY
jgi:hypothetical protein